MFWIAAFLFSSLLHAEDAVYPITLSDHRMSPAEIHVNAGQDFYLEVKNEDNTSEEMESRSLSFEKIVPPKRTLRIHLRKLSAGTYEIFGDFHSDTCQGHIVAR